MRASGSHNGNRNVTAPPGREITMSGHQPMLKVRIDTGTNFSVMLGKVRRIEPAKKRDRAHLTVAWSEKHGAGTKRKRSQCNGDGTITVMVMMDAEALKAKVALLRSTG